MGIISGVRNMIFGTNPSVSQSSTLTPEQQKYMNSLMNQGTAGMPGLQAGLNQEYNPQQVGTAFDAGGNAFISAKDQISAGLADINQQRDTAIGNALHGDERFSSSNALNRMRVAKEAGI